MIKAKYKNIWLENIKYFQSLVYVLVYYKNIIESYPSSSEGA